MKRLPMLCALGVVALPAVGARATAGRTIDLASGRVDGHPILGRTIAQVTAALGRPNFRVFRRSGGVNRAWSIVFERGPIRDFKVGDLLQRSTAFQKAVLAQYGTTFRLTRRYACKQTTECSGEFAARYGPIHVTFGMQPVTRTWLTIWE